MLFPRDSCNGTEIGSGRTELPLIILILFWTAEVREKKYPRGKREARAKSGNATRPTFRIFLFTHLIRTFGTLLDEGGLAHPEVPEDEDLEEDLLLDPVEVDGVHLPLNFGPRRVSRFAAARIFRVGTLDGARKSIFRRHRTFDLHSRRIGHPTTVSFEPGKKFLRLLPVVFLLIRRVESKVICESLFYFLLLCGS